MENKRIEAIMYMKFNNNDKRGSLLKVDNKGIALIDKPFKDVLRQASIEKNTIEKVLSVAGNDEETEVVLLWQSQIHANYIKTRGGR